MIQIDLLVVSYAELGERFLLMAEKLLVANDAPTGGSRHVLVIDGDMSYFTMVRCRVLVFGYAELVSCFNMSSA